MKRQDVREHLFRLLFRLEFDGMADMTEETAYYFVAPSEEEDVIDARFGEADRLYILKKYENIRADREKLDEIINDASRGWDIHRMGKVELTILRLAVYEILFDDDIPVGVAIDQAVELAKKYGQDESSAFVNGILANIARR
ncbi:MAG: transcription antitermination factor NusB [Lachnospiraceae bacterium]|nr:transcription antitermination factor NusB [Lachnospiraceae bacterium]